ncbi:MAG: ABC transporter permease [Rhodanobacteraceae bacterium]
MRSFRACATLAWENLRGSRGPAIYLVVTLAITVAVWLLLAAMAAPFVGGGNALGSGVTIRNGSQASAPMPLRYARRIIAVSGAQDVTWIGLQMVQCTPATTVSLSALGGPGAAASAEKDEHVAAAALKRWKADPLGVLISDTAASQCGWKTGQGIDPKSAFGGKQQIALHVVGTFRGSGAAASAPIGIAHFDYINRVAPLFGKDMVLMYSAHAAQPRDNDALAARIEAAFAHDYPTVTATANATQQNAWARYGKVQQLIGFVMLAIMLCAASVLVSVLAHAAAQRRAKDALLQVLGFRRGTLFIAVLLEVLAIVILGALIGTGIGMLTAHELAPTTLGLLSNGFVVPAWAYAWMPLWLAILAAASLAWPAALLARVRPSDYRAI